MTRPREYVARTTWGTVQSSTGMDFVIPIARVSGILKTLNP
jgi:hypothetical protein